MYVHTSPFTTLLFFFVRSWDQSYRLINLGRCILISCRVLLTIFLCPIGLDSLVCLHFFVTSDFIYLCVLEDVWVRKLTIFWDVLFIFHFFEDAVVTAVTVAHSFICSYSFVLCSLYRLCRGSFSWCGLVSLCRKVTILDRSWFEEVLCVSSFE